MSGLQLIAERHAQAFDLGCPSLGVDNATTTFEALLTSVLDTAYRSARFLAKDSTDAEDIVQEASLLAWRNFARFQLGTNFRGWFLRIVTNVFYSRIRKAKPSRNDVSLDSAADAGLHGHLAAADFQAAELDPSASFLRRVEGEEIADALASLPLEFRAVAAYYFVQDLGYAEIATILDIPVGTVRSRLHRARRLLQRKLWDMAVERGIVCEVQD